MTRPPNDPLTNPQPGDVVRRKDVPETDKPPRMIVQARCGNLVAFTADWRYDKVFWRTLDAWADLCHGAEVLHVAQQ